MHPSFFNKRAALAFTEKDKKQCPVKIFYISLKVILTFQCSITKVDRIRFMGYSFLQQSKSFILIPKMV